MSTVPAGMPVTLDDDVQVLDGGRVLLGGDPGRLLRLRTDAAQVLERFVAGDGVDLPTGRLVATLVDGGLAHPRPARRPVGGVDVVVPVRDRADELARCLVALGTAAPVLVVDDGSHDPRAVAEVCRRFGARVLHLAHNAGPAAARNAGLAATSADLVAFIDSDCVPPRGWLGALVGHLADPRVGAVAPRVRGESAGCGALSRYAAARSPLDLGPREARVRPGSRVSYVPTAALLVRRTALPPSAPFDVALRYGEDVDLVWRLHDDGWSVRYDPRTVVDHAEPSSWVAWLRRRHAYGRSAASLAQRHGGRLSPLVLPPWPTACWALLASGRPVTAAAAAAVPAGKLFRRLRAAGVPATPSACGAIRTTGRGVVSTARGVGGAGSVVSAPLLVALLAVRSTRRAATVALLAPPLFDWWARRPPVDPLRWSVLRLADDLAYASGVWRGCWSKRTVVPLLPRLSRPR